MLVRAAVGFLVAAALSACTEVAAGPGGGAAVDGAGGFRTRDPAPGTGGEGRPGSEGSGGEMPGEVPGERPGDDPSDPAGSGADPEPMPDPDGDGKGGCPDGGIPSASPGGLQCAPPCPSGVCPAGLVCHQVPLPSGENALHCLEPHATLCQPCVEHADCNPDTSSTHHRCLRVGAQGDFCATNCGPKGAACPAGYTCEPTPLPTGETLSLCKPLDGSCECNGWGVVTGASMTCKVENEVGICEGHVRCLEVATEASSGLGPCQGPSAEEESCDGHDDDCDGEIDEDVMAPCGGCTDQCTLSVVPGGAEVPDVVSGPGIQELDGEADILEHPFIWIANSAESTVSRLNTDTGCEEARYYVCANPSRTAVDYEGNGIVGCRDDGHVMKIAIFESSCQDKNGNGVIDTVHDTSGDCHITPDEMVSGDECILWNSAPDGDGGCGAGQGCARAAGVDADGNVWIGMWSSSRLWKLDGETGAPIYPIPITARPYGLAIDPEQTIWVASRDSPALLRVDPSDGQVGSWGVPAGQAYGLAVDPYGFVWVAGGEGGGVQRFDPDNQTWQTFTNQDGYKGNTRGVAVKVDYDPLGNVAGARVFVAHHNWPSGCSGDGLHRSVLVVDAKTLQVLPTIDIGGERAPVGVAIDAKGKLWTVNQCESTASRVNTETGAVEGTWPVGLQPYTYSDMTGYALKTITSIKGDFRHVFEGWKGANTKWESVDVEAILPNETTWLEVRYRIGITPETLPNEPWSEPFGPFPPATFPLALGITAPLLEVKVTGYAKSMTALPSLQKVTVSASKL